jgi:hypothetical protein
MLCVGAKAVAEVANAEKRMDVVYFIVSNCEVVLGYVMRCPVSYDQNSNLSK